MSKSSTNYNDIFKNGHPCTFCLIKAMCKRNKGKGDLVDCDLPEQYDFWNLSKGIRKFERAAKKGDKESIESLANLAKKMLKQDKNKFDALVKEMKRMRPLIERCKKDLNQK
jgi:hypothetical protein